MFSSLKTNGLHRRGQRGFSLTEFAVVLGIMGIVLGGLWSVVSIVRENIKRSEMRDQIILTVNNIRDYYMAKAAMEDSAGATTGPEVTAYLLKQNVLPAEMLRSPGVWIADQPWGGMGASGDALAEGGVLVDAATVDPSQFFRIQLRGLGESSCIALVPSLSGPGAAVGLESVTINGNFHDSLPVAPDIAAGECVDPAGEENTLEFVYRLRKSVS